MGGILPILWGSEGAACKSEGATRPLFLGLCACVQSALETLELQAVVGDTAKRTGEDEGRLDKPTITY